MVEHYWNIEAASVYCIACAITYTASNPPTPSQPPTVCLTAEIKTLLLDMAIVIWILCDNTNFTKLTPHPKKSTENNSTHQPQVVCTRTKKKCFKSLFVCDSLHNFCSPYISNFSNIKIIPNGRIHQGAKQTKRLNEHSILLWWKRPFKLFLLLIEKIKQWFSP